MPLRFPRLEAWRSPWRVDVQLQVGDLIKAEDGDGRITEATIERIDGQLLFFRLEQVSSYAAQATALRREGGTVVERSPRNATTCGPFPANTPSSLSPMAVRAPTMLCDFVQEIGGKLYIIGGGWTTRNAPGQVLMGVAVRLLVPENEANEPLNFELVLVDQDGQPVNIPEQGPVRVDGQMEVGRPPGHPIGMDLDASLGVTLAFPLGAGRYRFDLNVNGNPAAQVSFWVKAALTPGAARAR